MSLIYYAEKYMKIYKELNLATSLSMVKFTELNISIFQNYAFNYINKPLKDL